MTSLPLTKLDRKDFQTANDVRWCPGCGDYAILATVQRTFAELGLARENTVFISGIGCAARFPYYMNTYGMHSIHGRAPTIATGLKLTRPELSVWVVTGDGDCLSIGANHTLHMLRRNVDLNVLLFNNRVYGLTKGQYSPTSHEGMVAKSTPFGSIDRPVNPLSFALSAGATFVARSIDSDAKHLGETLKRAYEHKGTSFVEIYQNCVVFNDDTFSYLTNKETRAQQQLVIAHGQPLVFAAGNKGIGVDKTLSPHIIDLIAEPHRVDEVIVHDETDDQGMLGHLLAKLDHPEFPVPIGVLRAVVKPTYDDRLKLQRDELIRQKGKGTLEQLFKATDTWQVS